MVDVASANCPACGQGNPAGQKFCGECGSPLPAVCAACGFANPAGQKFCGECGNRLAGAAPPPRSETRAPTQAASPAVAAPAPPPPEEERRLVTALFCDLVGFTPLSEALDPEEVREIQGAYFGQVSKEIHRFGGTVEKYAGDAVLALFGAPIAHEDDAERAVRCALAMQQAFRSVAENAAAQWGAELAVRIGVNTGEAISGAWDVEGRRDYTATGDVVNTAARLQSSADPGGVIVGPETMRLAQRMIVFGERKDLTLKGKASAFPAYPVVGLREQMAERWETRGQRAPLIGRESELARLMEAWTRAQQGRGQVLTVVAEAGVGKSRLLSEAVERMRETADVAVVRGRCLSYGQELSLHLIADLLRTLCKLRESDDQYRVHAHLRETVDLLLVTHDQMTRDVAVDVLGTVLGLQPGESIVSEAGAHVRRQSLVRSLQLLLSALAAYQPVILLLEDLHWIDDASAEVLAELLPGVPDSQLLLLATQRPQWNARWSAWPLSQILRLQPLPEEDALSLARAVLGDRELEPELERQVTERAGGNPFFVEELLRSLQESGDIEERDGRLGLASGAAERLPSTLTEVLLARLDRLDRSARSIAQIGSVIGRSFAVRLLARAAEQPEYALQASLSALHQAEIAIPRTGAEPEYVFRHATVREVAYNTLLQRRRQALHGTIARAVIELYPAEELVEIIAYHFSRTQEHAEAAKWLERSADRAASAYANAAAIEQYEEARSRLEKCEAEESALARVDEKLGRVLKIVARYDEALTALERAAGIYRDAVDPEQERQVVAEIGRVHRMRGTPEEGIARIQGLLASLNGAPTSPGLASLYVALARLFFVAGRSLEQLETAQKASELAGELEDRQILAEAEMSRGVALNRLGRTEESLQAWESAIPLAEAAGDFDVLNILLGNTGNTYLNIGEFEKGRLYRERGVEVVARMGDPANLAFMRAGLGQASFLLGHWDEARNHCEQAVSMTRKLGPSWHSAYTLIYVGALQLATGDWEPALRNLEEAAAVAAPSGDLQALLMVQTSLAQLDLMKGDGAAALARFDGILDASRLEEMTYALPAVALAHLESGNLAEAESTASLAIRQAVQEHGYIDLVEAQRISAMVAACQERWEDAIGAFEETLALTQVAPYPYGEARVRYEYGLMYIRREEPEKASELLEQSLAIFQRLGAHPYVDRTQELLATISP